MLGDNRPTGRSPKYLTYLTAVLGIKLHTNIILQNLKSLHLEKYSSPKLQNRILRYCIQKSLGMFV